MTIQTFLTEAVHGGWIPKSSNWQNHPLSWRIQAVVNRSKFVERYLLDPEAWEAVGRVEGKEKDVCDWCGEASCWEGDMYCSRYKTAGVTKWSTFKMIEMVKYLCASNTNEIEAYLETL